jgi:hypothetical protein
MKVTANIGFHLLLFIVTTQGRIVDFKEGLHKYAYQTMIQTSAFNFRFSCEAGTDFCKKAERVFSRVGDRVASEFRIRRAINVDLGMFLPCGQATTDPQCPETKILGFASPKQRIPVRHRDDNQIYLYPTGLLKQTDVEGVDQMVWPEVDITAKFNIMKSWYFADDGVAIVETQRDLELTALHEILHGLGYGDDYLTSNQPDKRTTQLVPYYWAYPSTTNPPSNGNIPTNPTNGVAFAQFANPSIWNRFTYSNGRSLLDHLNVFQDIFNRFKSSNSLTPFTSTAGSSINAVAGQFTLESVLAALRSDATAKSLMDQLYKDAITPGTLEFRTNVWPANSPLRTTQVLDTSAPFSEGSTASHIAMAYNTTGDFLTVRSAGGKSLSMLIEMTNAPASGIGPNVKDAMMAMGLPPSTGDIPSRRSIARIDFIPAGRSGGVSSQTLPGVGAVVVLALVSWIAMLG